MPISVSAHFPKLIDFTDVNLREKGYRRRAVSVFDHWLSAEEAEVCDIFSFGSISSVDERRRYLVGELSFLAFYKQLFSTGVIRKTIVGPFGAQLGLMVHDRWDRRLKAAVIRSLRERGPMDVYIPKIGIRVQGGFDRTDQLLLESGADEGEIERLAVRSGLFLLHPIQTPDIVR